MTWLLLAWAFFATVVAIVALYFAVTWHSCARRAVDGWLEANRRSQRHLLRIGAPTVWVADSDARVSPELEASVSALFAQAASKLGSS